MASYKLQWLPSACSDLKKIHKKYVSKIIRKIEKLCDEPYSRGARKLKDADKSYRLRLGDYRIIYQVDGQTITITIIRIRHRKDVYRQK